MAELFRLPLDQLDPPTDVLRREIVEEEVRALAESIRAVGLLQPIGVVAAGTRHRIVFGHRRSLALRWLGETHADCRLLSADEAGELQASAAENVVRRDLSPVEEARAIRSMIERQGRSVREVGRALGRSESWVRTRLEVLLWPDELVELVGRGELSVAVARELVAVEDEAMRSVYVRCAVENGVTAAQARMWRSEWELQRSLGNGGVPPTVVSGEAPAVVLPQAMCQVCDEVLPVTAFQFVRACTGCALELANAKRAARAAG